MFPRRWLAAVFMVFAVSACQTTDEMSYTEKKQFFQAIADRCAKEHGAKTGDEHQECVKHEWRRHNVSVARRREAMNSVTTCSSIGNTVVCY